MEINYNIIILGESFDDELVLFLDNLANINQSVLGYHYPFYRKILESIGIGEPLYIGVLNNEHKLIAYLPGFIKTAKEGTVYSSLPFFGPNAGVICNYQSNNAEEIHRIVLNFLLKELEKYDMISISLYTPFNTNNIIPVYDQLLGETLSIEKFTNYINLNEFTLNPSLAYDIRKATKSNVVITTEITAEEAEEIFTIYHQNCIDYGIPPKPKECIHLLIKNQHVIPNVKTYLAKVEEKVIGALIMIFSPLTASYYLPCSLHEYRSYQPTTLLIHYAINECKKKGITYWNWESSPSKDSGVFKFKKKWGSTEGHYKIYIQCYKPTDFYKSMGMNRIQEAYPYFFVYPFNQLH